MYRPSHSFYYDTGQFERKQATDPLTHLGARTCVGYLAPSYEEQIDSPLSALPPS